MYVDQKNAKYTKSTAGFSLIELLIASSILCVVALASLSVIVDLLKVVKTSDARQDMAMLYDEVSLVLNAERTCTNTLAGVQNNNGVAVTLGPQIQTGGSFGALNLNSVQLASSTNLVGNMFMGTVLIQGNIRGQIVGSGLFSNRAQVFYEVDGSNNIVRCLAAGFNSQTACRALGGNWNGSSCDLCEASGGQLIVDGFGNSSCQYGSPSGGCTPPADFIWGQCSASSGGVSMADGETTNVTNTAIGYFGSTSFTCLGGTITHTGSGLCGETVPLPAQEGVWNFDTALGYWWSELGGDIYNGPLQPTNYLCYFGDPATPSAPYTCPSTPCTVGQTHTSSVSAFCNDAGFVDRTDFSAVYRCRCQ